MFVFSEMNGRRGMSSTAVTNQPIGSVYLHTVFGDYIVI